jgi:hypothetical protein
MIEYQKEAILISFLNEKVRYKKLAEYIVHLIGDDPSSPKESLHTIISYFPRKRNPSFFEFNN